MIAMVSHCTFDTKWITCELQSEEFPLEISILLDILEIVAPFKHFEKLRRFCEVRLPPGFPIRLGMFELIADRLL